MTAFILSSAIAFALYELLVSVNWPTTPRRIRFYWGSLALKKDVAPGALNLIRAAIVITILLSTLVIHTFTSPNDLVSKYEVNVVFGSIFGPLFAIWVNNIVLHPPKQDLSRVQIFAAVGLLLLFFLGAVGNETAGLLRRWSNSLSSLKIPGAELSFQPGKERSDRVSATPFAGSGAATFVSSASPGLSNLSVLDQIIQRDRDYLRLIFSPAAAVEAGERSESEKPAGKTAAGGAASRIAGTIPVEDLDKAQAFAQVSIVPPLACLSDWYERTGDSRSVDKHIVGYVGAFRQLEAMNAQIDRTAETTQPADRKNLVEARLGEIATDFVGLGLGMALDIASSIAPNELPDKCGQWFDIYCPRSANGNDGLKVRQCLAMAWRQFDPWSSQTKSGTAASRISFLAQGLADFIPPQKVDTRGLEALPYFAIARASLMAQLGQHRAAASILDDWLRLRNQENERDAKKAEYEANPLLRLKDEWFVLRARATLATYIEDWMNRLSTTAATVVQTEHVENLRISLEGFKKRLLRVNFFKEMERACQTRCEPVFKRPTECSADEPLDRLKLWQKLYTSYISFKYAYIHRALAHPDYPSQFAETINNEARRLVNYDSSCTEQPDLYYAQSLLAFVENAIAYSRVRLGLDSEDTQKKRIEEARQAAKLGLEIVKMTAAEEQERTGQRYLNRIAPSFAVDVQEGLNIQLKRLEQLKKELTE